MEEFEDRLVFTHPSVEIQAKAILDSDPSIDNAQIHSLSGVTYVQDSHDLTGSGQTVAIIDSGIAYDHPALGGGYGAGYRVVGGWDFAENDANPFDDAPAGFHGTHVAGIVGSADETHRGVAPDVDFVALRVYDDYGRSNFEWVEEALQWVSEHKDSFANPITTVNLSMGSSSHSNSAPAWSIIEDELALLRSQGIFVTAAAGNDFDDHQTVGLNYPASSSNVVPVASHGITNQISDFSQRNSRVLVAPGEHITSTVSDFIYDFNGRTDDFASVSGTSMAAPYLAGASVLVRQALQVEGRDSTPDQISQILRETATSVYDAETRATYQHINVEAAINSIVTIAPPNAHVVPAPSEPAGPIESTVSLGQLDDVIQRDGNFDSDNEVDFYTFVPTRTGTVSVAAHGSATGKTSWITPNGQTQTNHAGLDFAVQANETYTIGLTTTEDSANQYQLLFELTPETVPLGTIDWQEVYVDGDARRLYEVRAARQGFLTIEAEVGRTGELAVYDADMTPLTIDASSGHLRAEKRVEHGEVAYFEFTGNDQNVPVRIANVVSLTRAGLNVFTTDGQDRIDVSMVGRTTSISFNGISYDIDFRKRSSVNVFGDRGTTDTVYLTTSHDAENVQLQPRSLATSGGRHSVNVHGIERIHVYASNSESSVHFDDSHSFDTFTGLPEYSVLQGDGFFNYARGFSKVTSDSSRGGNDKAMLYDSAKDDTLIGEFGWSSIQNDTFSIRVDRYAAVETRAINGGNDVAMIYDSAANDTLHSLPSYSILEGGGRSEYASGFERTQVYATSGGHDVARLYDSASNDIFYATPTYGLFEGDGFRNYAAGFDQVRAYSHQGGRDIARLFGSEDRDTFFGLPDYAVMQSGNFDNYAGGFAQVRAYGHAEDQAKLYGSDESDRFFGLADYSVLVGASFDNYARGFGEVFAFGGEGNDVNRLFDDSGSEVFRATANRDRQVGIIIRNVSQDTDRDWKSITRQLSPSRSREVQAFFAIGYDGDQCVPNEMEALLIAPDKAMSRSDVQADNVQAEAITSLIGDTEMAAVIGLLSDSQRV